MTRDAISAPLYLKDGDRRLVPTVQRAVRWIQVADVDYVVVHAHTRTPKECAELRDLIYAKSDTMRDGGWAKTTSRRRSSHIAARPSRGSTTGPDDGATGERSVQRAVQTVRRSTSQADCDDGSPA